MFLNVFDQISEYFTKTREMTNLQSIIPLLIGILIGCVISVLFYLTTVLTPLRKQEKKEIKLSEGENENVKLIIKNAKNQFIEESSSKPTNEKFEDLKIISGNLIYDIAKIYYPESSHPIYELSAEEMFNLSRYITDRIESIFSGKVLTRVKRINISSVLKVLDIKKKYEEKKIVKAATKAQLPAIWKSTLAAINIINPVYWIKKIMIDAPFVAASNKIALTIIEIIGNETGKVYSKSLFTSDDKELNKTVEELEEMLANVKH